MPTKAELDELAAQLSVDAIRAFDQGRIGSSHIGAVGIASHGGALRQPSPLGPQGPARSGGRQGHLLQGSRHTSPLRTAQSGRGHQDEQLLTYRKFDSPLQGHPIPTDDMPWVDVGTGALGQGLPIGFGMAMGMRLRQLPGRVWVLMGDSRDGRGIGVGGDGERLAPRVAELGGDPRHEPARPTRADDVGVGW